MYKIIYLDVVDSTHLYLKQKCGIYEDSTAVIARNQTNAIGTNGRSWYTGHEKNIAMSILYKPCNKIFIYKNLTIDIAKAIKKVIYNLYKIRLEIKYPNDLLLNNKKIAGILTQINTIGEKVDYIIISVGFNVNEIDFSDDLIDIATSLKLEFSKNFGVEQIVKNILLEIDNLIKEKYIK